MSELEVEEVGYLALQLLLAGSNLGVVYSQTPAYLFLSE
jgi:hypothetical protein